MNQFATWGVCSTIKAPAEDVLRFAAHHLDAGAQRIWVYLDTENAEVYETLDAHPKCTVITCTEEYWKRIFGRRPAKLQTRQARNAARTLARAGEVDWLLHIDVDEFVVAPQPVAAMLAALPEAAISARIRPMEVLARDDRSIGEMAFKLPIESDTSGRPEATRTIYPTFGDFLTGGFVSHVAGKLFVRTSRPDVTLHVHEALNGEERLPDEVTLDDAALARLHAPNWRSWLHKFDLRFAHGAYRPSALDASSAEEHRISLHDFFDTLVEQQGTEGLRRFFDEVCADTSLHRERLAERGLLRLHDLQLDAKVHQHFPDYGPIAATI